MVDFNQQRPGRRPPITLEIPGSSPAVRSLALGGWYAQAKLCTHPGRCRPSAAGARNVWFDRQRSFDECVA